MLTMYKRTLRITKISFPAYAVYDKGFSTRVQRARKHLILVCQSFRETSTSPPARARHLQDPLILGDGAACRGNYCWN
jgi:hypothetical protein